MNLLTQFWNRIGVTSKFGITIGILLLLIIGLAIISNIALTFSEQQTNNALETFEIQQLVLDMNLGLQAARVAERNFYLQYPTIGVPQAREIYAQPAISEIAEVITKSEQLNVLIDNSDTIGTTLKESDVDLNIYLSAAQRNVDVFLESIQLITQLAEPETGAEAQLAQTADELREQLNNTDLDWTELYLDIRVAEGNYLQTRQRPFFQTAFNNITILRNRIEAADTVTPQQQAIIGDTLDQYVALSEQIIEIDAQISSIFNDFEIQAQTVDPIADELITLADEEVARSEADIDNTTIVIRQVVIGVTVLTLLLALLTAYIINKTITQNILRLTETAQEIQSGNLNARSQVVSGDELGRLATTLNSMTEQIQSFVTTLEARVDARTRDLELAAEVSQAAATIINTDDLLPQVSELTKNTFNLYHVSVYVFDKTDQNLHLESGSGREGELMKQEDTQFTLNDIGAVAQAGRERKTILQNDTRSQDNVYSNPLLPETRSEVALPMVVGNTLIGVLNLHSEEVNHFTAEDLRVQQTLADRIGVSIRNAQLFDETQAARERAEQSDQVKSMFLASMSHELRTPLNAIINFSQFIGMEMLGEINARQKETIFSVIDSAEHLLNLINDVLDISKIESGSLKLFMEKNINLHEISQTAAENTKALLKDKPVSFSLTVSDDLPLIEGDRQRILQIMLNILSNACKFTQEGQIKMNVKKIDNQYIEVSVEDTGPGIANNDFGTVFEKFKQTNSGLRQGSGTGLGMPISKSLIEAHGGKIWLESQVGSGSIFRFTLPIQNEAVVEIEVI